MGGTGILRSRPERLVELVSARPVLSVFLVALVARLLAVLLVTFVLPEGWLALDDGTYTQLAADRAAGETAHWTSFEFGLYRSTGSLLVPLTALYVIFGPVVLVGRILVAVVGSLLAAAVTKLLLEKLSWRWSITAGLTVAFFPSQIAWSTIVLKDAFVWLGLASLALIVSISVRNSGWRLAALGTAGAVIVFFLGHLRLHSTFVAAWAAVVAIALISTTQRALRISAAALIALVVPWVSAGGPAGLEPVINQVGSLEELRLAHAEGAQSAIVPLPDQEPDSPVDLPADTVPADTVPADTVPADTVPADTVPADTVPADTVPADTVPADTVPADTVPADTVPADTVPADTVPADTVPADTVPADTVPADTVPADTVPADTVPADTVPADTAPADTVPADTVPARGVAAPPGGATNESSNEGAEEVSRSLFSRLRVDLAHLPRGLSVMVLRPYLWEASSSIRFVFAKIDTLLWYPLLAVAGSRSVGRSPRVVLFPLLTGSGIAVMYALSEGNLGTAFRHRGEFVWAVVVLAAFGAQRLRDRLLERGVSPSA